MAPEGIGNRPRILRCGVWKAGMDPRGGGRQTFRARFLAKRLGKPGIRSMGREGFSVGGAADPVAVCRRVGGASIGDEEVRGDTEWGAG